MKQSADDGWNTESLDRAATPGGLGLREAAVRVADEMHRRRLGCDDTGPCIGGSYHLVDAEPLALAAASPPEGAATAEVVQRLVAWVTGRPPASQADRDQLLTTARALAGRADPGSRDAADSGDGGLAALSVERLAAALRIVLGYVVEDWIAPRLAAEYDRLAAIPTSPDKAADGG